jgi:outer membrane protein W
MKKFISILVILGVWISAEAQKFEGGIVAGFNASQVDGDTYAGYNKIGIALGVFTRTKFTENLSGELQIRWMQKGASKKVTENDLSQYSSKLNYIEIPVLLQFHQSPKLSWHVGPGFNYLFHYSVEDENGPLNSHAISFRNFELAGMAGFEYQIIEKLGISVTFSYSLIPIADHPNDPVHFRQPGLYNNLVTLLLSYRL